MQLEKVVWTGMRFVALGSALDGAGAVILDSSDGVTWNRQAQTTNGVDGLPAALAAGRHGVVAVVASDEETAAWISSDGLTWNASPHAFPAPAVNDDAGPASFTVTGVVPTETGWLAVGREDPVCQLNCGTDPLRPLAWSSTDGLTWTAVAGTGSGPGGMNAVARTADGFVGVGLGRSRAAVWASPDATSWSPVPDAPIFHPAQRDPSLGVEMIGVAARDGVVVAAGMEGLEGGGNSAARAWWSADGRSWSKGTGEQFSGGQVFGLASTPAGFLMVGPPVSSRCLGGVWESSDGRAWTCVAADAAFAGFGAYAAAASETVEVVVGLDAAGPETDDGFPGAIWLKRLD